MCNVRELRIAAPSHCTKSGLYSRGYSNAARVQPNMEPILVEYKGDLRSQVAQPGGQGPLVIHAHGAEESNPDAFSPMQLLVISMASCMLSSIGHAAGVHGIPVGKLQAGVSFTLHRKPTRLASVCVELHVEGPAYDEKQKRILQLASEACPVYRSLAQEVEKQVVFVFANGEGA